MKIAGFSFIRNASKYDYPVIEAITSILPLCDEFIVVVGASEDNTLDLIQSIESSKIKIIHSVWDDTLREGGLVLAKETDKAIAAISTDVDWAFYVQGDEVVHEEDLPKIKIAMSKHLLDQNVDGLLFNYFHFYGSYKYVADSRRWYRKEIRVIRNKKNIYAYRDAQGFRKDNNKKLQVKVIDASIYHYGWVKSLDKQRLKFGDFYKLWRNDIDMISIKAEAEKFKFEDQIDSLYLFRKSHPSVMDERIEKSDDSFYFDTEKKRYSMKVKILNVIEKLTGWRVGEYKNYKII